MLQSLTIVLYHDVSESETHFEQGLGVLTRPELFRAHVEYFRKHYDVVGLSDVLSGKLPRRALLITFDDYYYSVLEAARDQLHPHRLPSLFFINPALLGGTNVSLDNALAFCANRFGLAELSRAIGLDTPVESLRVLIAQIASGWCASRRRDVRDLLLETLGPRPEDLRNRKRVLEATDLPLLREYGVEIGNHTATHIHGRSVTGEELEDEIAGSRRRLEELSGSEVRSFSLPYGSEIDLTPQVLASVRSSGHQATFLVHARSNHRRKADDIWYRVSLHNEPVSELRRQLTWFPALRSLRHAVTG